MNFWRSFIKIVSLIKSREILLFSAIFNRALVSLGKQDPPYPIPAFKNFSPILSSNPIPVVTISISAPNTSHKLAMLLIYDIFNARNELDAYFIISAFFLLVINLVCLNLLYIFIMIAFADSVFAPMIIL